MVDLPCPPVFLRRKFWVIIRRQPAEKTQRYKNNFYDDGHIEDGDLGATQIKIERQPATVPFYDPSQSRTDKVTDKEIWDSFSPRLLQLWCPPPPPLYKFHLEGSSVQTQLNLVVKHRHQIEIAYQWLSVLCMSVHRIKFCRDKPLIRFLRSTTFRRAINFKWWQFHLNLVWGIILMIEIGQRLIVY